MNEQAAARLADKVLSRMTLEEKIGQCLTMVWRGSLVTPSIVETITRLHVGGLRIEPIFTESALRHYYGYSTIVKDFRKPRGYFKIAETYFRPKDPAFTITATEYARRLNRLKEIAMNRRVGVPLHCTTDFEGNFSHDFPFDGICMFPANMGLRAAGPPELAYRVGGAIARQLSAIGVNMLHSPVCDVNINPANPEIGIRSFCDDRDVFLKYVMKFWQGLEDGGLIATAKHFPGRGDSTVDAHDVLPVIPAPAKRLRDVELAPYRALIARGLRAVMTAHTAYPALDGSGLPATLSRRILIDLLRNELGFTGVITTDAMGMGAISKRWGVPVACAMALKAGCNLVLPKFEGEQRSQVFFEIKRWVDDGRISERELDERVRAVLVMKARRGLFRDGGVVDAERATTTLREKAIVELSKEAAGKACIVLRDRKALLPLRTTQKVMIVEQVMWRRELVPNDMWLHDHSFNEAMLAHSLNVVNVATENQAALEERRLVLSLLRDVDVVVLTNFYMRSARQDNRMLIRDILRRGKPVVVVTNDPYLTGTPEEVGTVICTFSSTPESRKAAAGIIYGALRPRGSWPLQHTKQPGQDSPRTTRTRTCTYERHRPGK